MTSSILRRLKGQSPAERQGISHTVVQAANRRLVPGVFQGSQLTDFSSRFPAHVQEIREFLLKEKLPVPSPDAIPQLSSRIGSDPRFRADVASLMRATLYQEREGIGYEDLLGILVAAAAGTEHDLKSNSQEADIREMLRFLLQSRRSTFRPEAEGTRVSVEPEPRESVPVSPVTVNSEPVRARRLQSPTHSMKLELRSTEPPIAVAEGDSREPGGDVVLPPFLTAGLLAAQPEREASWWRVHSTSVVGVVALLLGLGAGLMVNRGVLARVRHAAVSAADRSLSKTKTAASIAPQESATPAGAVQTASVVQDGAGVHPAPAVQVPSSPRPAASETSSGVPLTVVKQVVTASPSGSSDSADAADDAQPTAKTQAIVPRASADITPANVIFSPPPEYPVEAAAARVHGQVTVRAVVDPEGNVIYTHAVSGPPVLRDAATEAVQRWRYRPLLYNGKPIAVTTVAILDFKVAR